VRLSRSKVGDHINYRKKRSLALASILQSLAAVEISDTLHLRDFQGRSIFRVFQHNPPKLDVQNYEDLRKSVFTLLFLASRFAILRQHPRCATDAAPKGFIERDAAKLPSVWSAGPVDRPLRGPSEVPIIPDQASDQSDFPALLGRERDKRRGRRLAQLPAVDTRFRQRRGLQHNVRTTPGNPSDARASQAFAQFANLI
jgi:hypothetical protein